jgi:carbamate kinase
MLYAGGFVPLKEGFSLRDGKFCVLAIGGNALIRDRSHESIQDQYEMVCRLAVDIAGMIEAGWRVVVTHGNGPQVGFILRRSEISIHEVPPVPMDYAGADIQGAVGYMFVKALRNEFRRRGLKRDAVAIVTQTIVDRADPAFANPTKPIGSHMEEKRAKELAARYQWTVREDAGRGWRRVVPSPRPQAVVEARVIGGLAEQGYVVVAGGGGGIPVMEDEKGELTGIEAVIDKDFTSSLLARSMGADTLVLPTGVEKVAIDFNKPTQRWLDRMTVSEAKKHAADNQFDPGSMGPKVGALIDFVSGGGKLGLITNQPSLTRALRGETGTRVVAG